MADPTGLHLLLASSVIESPLSENIPVTCIGS
jgi:hypothetical protein